MHFLRSPNLSLGSAPGKIGLIEPHIFFSITSIGVSEKVQLITRISELGLTEYSETSFWNANYADKRIMSN
jgi:hypothetical protein